MNSHARALAAIALSAAFLPACVDSNSFSTSFMPDVGFGVFDPAPDARPDQSLKLRHDMRKLWSDHVIWTRDYIIAATADLPSKDAAAKRLLRNQEDIGAAIAAYYGKAAGDQLTALLKEHITIAVDLIAAAKAGDKAKVTEIDQRWQKNGDDIADFLSKANPNWSKATLADMMKMHLKTTTDEVTARLEKNWDRDVKSFDAVYDHILKMADALSDGIIRQYPDRFSDGGAGER